MIVSVIGGGSWATALTKILAENSKTKVRWWMRSKEMVEHIRAHHHNPRYLSSIEFHPSRVKTYHQINKAIAKSQIVLLAVPAAFLQDALAGLKPEDFSGKIVISAIKGMIPGSDLLVTDYLKENFHIPLEQQAVIGGPCHAEEVALEKQSYLTIAASEYQIAQELLPLFTCRYVKSSALADIYGVEYAAVMKNIVALACGISHGMGAGDNFQAVMVSNAMIEIKRFVNTIAPGERDMSASAYLGDLLVTAYSQFSRNRAFGNMIGRGYSVKSAQMEMNMIAEGYYAVKSIYEVKKNLNIEMPITDFVYGILYEKNSLKREFESLKTKLT